MNTIHTTLNDRPIRYTVIGGPKGAPCPDGIPISVLLLSRGGRLYRTEVFEELERLGFESVISVEEGPEVGDASALAQRYPRTRFVILSEKASPGEEINIGMREACTPFVFVLWSDMRIQTAGLSSRFFERISAQNRLCVAPYLQAHKGELLPSAIAPALEKQSLRLIPFTPAADGAKSLYPFDYCGIYSRDKFVLSGGYDGGIGNPYWQKLDFGFRAWLWGEEICLAQALRVGYEDEPPQEDATPDENYKWFWLKNLAPVYRGDSGMIPNRHYWSYLRSRKGNPFAALSEYRAAVEWVRINRYRFRCDASSVVDLWEDETHDGR
jgi:hypothetical protein